MFRFSLSLLIFFAGACAFSQHVLAVTPQGAEMFGGTVTVTGGTLTTTGAVDSDKIAGTIINAVNWFAWFVAIAGVAVSLYSGFLLLTSRGSPRQTEVAGRTLIFLVAGVVVSILAFSGIAITKGLLGGAPASVMPTCPTMAASYLSTSSTGDPQCCDASGTSCIPPVCPGSYVLDVPTPPGSGFCVLP